MTRLTKKYDGENKLYADSYVKPDYESSFDWDERCIDKLGQLEDIEEELGIDLITLFKALKNGIYYKYVKLDGKMYDDEIYFEKPEHLSIGLKGLICAYTDYYGDDLRYDYEYKDCHITWAFINEELE